jgi:hypothetical protein
MGWHVKPDQVAIRRIPLFVATFEDLASLGGLGTGQLEDLTLSRPDNPDYSQ